MKEMEPIVIFGAGKIARGFINHLLAGSGYRSVFVEKSPELCALINRRGSYTVHVLGNELKNTEITGAVAVCLDDTDAVTAYLEKAELVFTAVGGKNLPQVVPVLAEGIRRRFEMGVAAPLNIVTCENWKNPAAVLKAGVQERLSGPGQAILEEWVGFSEAVVMRSAIESEPADLAIDPLVVNVQDFWSLPIDGTRLRGTLPPVTGIEPMDDFGGFLERKFYTYNAANGTVSYVGALLGHTHIAPASRDPFVAAQLEKVYEETAEALCRKHGVSRDEQKAFAESSLRKIRDEKIVDTLERNARDPLRKLSPDDRLIGSARLMLEQGVQPDGILTSIACAIFYLGAEADESARALKEMRRTRGVEAVLTEVCGLTPSDPLWHMIESHIAYLVDCGKIEEKVVYTGKPQI